MSRAVPPERPFPGPLPQEQTGEAPGAESATGTDAQSGRSPLIEPGLVPAAATTALAALLAGTAGLPLPVFAGAVVVLQAVTAAGWFRLNGMWPARQGIALAFLAGVGADVAVLVVAPEDAATALVAVFGVWFLLNLVLHLRNRSAADERLYALTAALTSTALTVAAAGHLAALAGDASAARTDTVVVGAAAVAAAAVVRALPSPPYVSPALAALAAAGAGYAMGEATGLPGGGLQAALLGLAAGVCALVGLRTASYDFPSRFVHMTAGVALPLTLAAPAVYAGAQLLT